MRLTATLALAGLLSLTTYLTAREEGKVEEGKPAPAVELPAANIAKVLTGKKDGDMLNLKDLKDKNIVLFFYPKAMTSGCTIESCGFRDKVKTDDFAKLDTVIIGISTDKVEDQIKFIEKEKLNFPLLADP